VSEIGHNRVDIFKNNGSGTLALPTTASTGLAPVALAVAFVNGDASPDLVIANRESNSVSVLINNGSGAFTRTDLGVGTRPLSLALGNFNADGFTDIATANETSADVSLLLTTGAAGSYGAAVPIMAGESPTAVAAADINNDSKVDLIVVNGSVTVHSVAIMLGSGLGSFAMSSNVSVGRRPTAVAIGEFNGDGNADLAVTDPDLASILVLHGSGTGSFMFTRNYGVGLYPSQVLPADANGDGLTDLLCGNFGSGTVSLLPNAGKNGKLIAGKR
jgi:hypothetical protein